MESRLHDLFGRVTAGAGRIRLGLGEVVVLAPDAVEVAGPGGKCEGCGAGPVLEERLDLDGSAFKSAEIPINERVKLTLYIYSSLAEALLVERN